MATIEGAANTAAAVGNSALVIGYYSVIACVVIAVMAFMIYRMSFNCKIRIHYLTQGLDQFSDKRGKIIKDKDGIGKLLISMGMFRVDKLPAPPPEATALDLKGKRCFMVEFGDDGSKKYIVRKKGTDDYVPLSTNDRVFYANEEDKRMQRQKKGIADLIAAAIPYIALVIILGMLLAFWGDVVKPLQDETAKVRAHTETMRQMDLEITGMLKEIIKKEQVVSSEPTPIIVPEISIAAESPPPPADA